MEPRLLLTRTQASYCRKLAKRWCRPSSIKVSDAVARWMRLQLTIRRMGLEDGHSRSAQQLVYSPAALFSRAAKRIVDPSVLPVTIVPIAFDDYVTNGS